MRIKSILKRVKSAITDPKLELNKWEQFIVYLWKVTQQGARQLSRDRAGMMAASLSYRTLFGLLPVTVVGASVARSIMGDERFLNFLTELIEMLGLNQVLLDTSEIGAPITLGSWLSDFVSAGMSVNLAAFTWVGILVLTYSALSLLVDIENCFNIIVRSKRGRSWTKRLPLYWFVFTFGPVLMALAFWTDTQVDMFFGEIITSTWLSWAFSHIWDFVIGWCSLVFLYKMVPTTKVSLKPVMAGAFVATLLLLCGKTTLGLYFNHAMSLKQLYGSIGLVPVFMFWLYVMWLIILLGLQITSIFEQITSEKPRLHAR